MYVGQRTNPVLCIHLGSQTPGGPDQRLVVTWTEGAWTSRSLYGHAHQCGSDVLGIGRAGLLDRVLDGIDCGVGTLSVIAGYGPVTLAVVIDELFVAIVIVGVIPVAGTDPDPLRHLLAQGGQNLGGCTNGKENLVALVKKAQVVGLAHKVHHVTAPYGNENTVGIMLHDVVDKGGEILGTKAWEGHIRHELDIGVNFLQILAKELPGLVTKGVVRTNGSPALGPGFGGQLGSGPHVLVFVD